MSTPTDTVVIGAGYSERATLRGYFRLRVGEADAIELEARLA